MEKKNRLRVAFISTCGPCDEYLIQQVASHSTVCGVFRPVAYGQNDGNTKKRWRRALRSPWRTASAILNNSWNDFIGQTANRRALRHLPEATYLDIAKVRRDIPQRSFNDPESADLIQACNPDVILVSGAPMIKQRITEIPRRGCFNIHYGITPHYRGEHCLFWPMLLHDYKNLGVTIHEITPVLDSGRIKVRGYPHLTPCDDESSIVAKCSILTATMVAGVLRDIADEIPSEGKISSDPTVDGRLIRYRDRAPWHSLKYRFGRHVLRQRPPTTQQTIESVSPRSEQLYRDVSLPQSC